MERENLLHLYFPKSSGICKRGHQELLERFTRPTEVRLCVNTKWLTLLKLDLFSLNLLSNEKQISKSNVIIGNIFLKNRGTKNIVFIKTRTRNLWLRNRFLLDHMKYNKQKCTLCSNWKYLMRVCCLTKTATVLVDIATKVKRRLKTVIEL